ncbi:LytS/YhcK type 5TM receptor domain-containing protein [Thalassorhabdus alkalitolerans]|uniref:histidine kinase n=1 Tax=Thalassorhabdus alkalitolerans TaxID=2282697 RepID=A0ABW0YFZ5_9BACI
MWELLLLMFERLGIIVTLAFIMTRLPFFRQLLDQRQLTTVQAFSITVIFGLFGIVGTYTGLTFSPEEGVFSSWAVSVGEDEAIANSRVIGVVAAGLLGGIKVGLGAGLIAGLHRYSLGGFTDFACGLSSVIAGLLAGLIHSKLKKQRIISVPVALFAGAAAEAIQMAVILGVARPFDLALALVQEIGVPMIVANGAGTAIFILIIQNVINEEERMGALQSQKALRIADRTINDLRQGLTPDSAKSACNILLKEVEVSGVAITNKESILAHSGLGADHHAGSSPIKTKATQEVIQTGKMKIAKDGEIECRVKDCPIKAAIIAPLKQKGETIGTLKFYFEAEKEVTPLNVELMSGLSLLLSSQLELAEVEHQQKLAREAEIKALQAQVNPHFLFNALNTIVSLIRTDPAKARKLLLALSNFFRKNLSASEKSLTTLEEELNQVKSYLAIEEARFFDKLEVIYEVDDTLLYKEVPPMTLQPLIENALKHGLKDKYKDRRLKISIQKEDDRARVSVTDNGAGMTKERLAQLKEQSVESKEGAGIGVYNVNRRLEMTFGEESALHIESTIGEGSCVFFYIRT